MLRAHFIQVCVVSMHQNGRDTHIRQAKIYGPRDAENRADRGRRVRQYNAANSRAR